MKNIPTTPNLAVIDLAVKLVQNDREKYSCCALSAAEGQLVTDDYNCNSYYRYQYKQYIFSICKGKLPRWWNSTKQYKTARIKALKGFKQACIDAAKKG